MKVAARTSCLQDNAMLRPSRAAWADLCRALAIFGVVMIHACGAAFYAFEKIPLSDWLAANALDSLSRAAVPLFLMLSGALLLRQPAQAFSFELIIKRLARVAIPLVAWSLLYLYRNQVLSGQPSDWLSILVTPAMYHLWFAYTMVGIYLLLPFLAAMFETVRHSNRAALYLTGLWVAAICMPVYLRSPTFEPLLGYCGYFLLGALLATRQSVRLPVLAWVALYLVACSVTFLLTWHYSATAHAPVERFYNYFAPNVALGAVGVFMAVIRFECSQPIASCLQWLQEHIFIVFFVHVYVLELVRYSETIISISQGAPAGVTIVLICLVTYLICLAAAAAIRLVPGAHRVFG